MLGDRRVALSTVPECIFFETNPIFLANTPGRPAGRPYDGGWWICVRVLIPLHPPHNGGDAGVSAWGGLTRRGDLLVALSAVPECIFFETNPSF